MAWHPGAPGFWQVAVELVAEGSISVGANAGVEIGPLRADASLDAYGTGLNEHAFFLPPSVYVRANGVVTHLGPIFDTPGVYPLDIYAALVRKYAAGPPAKHDVYLRIRNLSASAQTAVYKVYRWKGLK